MKTIKQDNEPTIFKSNPPANPRECLDFIDRLNGSLSLRNLKGQFCILTGSGFRIGCVGTDQEVAGWFDHLMLPEGVGLSMYRSGGCFDIAMSSFPRFVETVNSKLTWSEHANLSRVASIYRELRIDRRTDLGELAQRHKVSARTLQRRLRSSGVQFQMVTDTTRFREVLDQFLNEDGTVEQIAFNCRYSDASALRKALFRWLGGSPNGLRKWLSEFQSSDLY